MPCLQFEMVAFSKKLLELGKISCHEWALTQSPVLHPCHHKAQDRVCPLGLISLIGSHAGDLSAILYYIQDVQVTTVCLNGAHRAFEGGLLHSMHCCCSDSVVDAQSIWACSQAKPPSTRHPH